MARCSLSEEWIENYLSYGVRSSCLVQTSSPRLEPLSLLWLGVAVAGAQAASTLGPLTMQGPWGKVVPCHCNLELFFVA